MSMLRGQGGLELSVEKQAVLEKFVADLSTVPGIIAIVLGGSYARGTQHETSDLDLGLLYSETNPFSIEEIRRVTSGLSVQGPPTVSDVYGWGPWVNGGAWVHTEAGRVDLIYRNMEQLEKTIADARRGVVYQDYSQQATFGFYSVAYLEEVRIAVPLYDPHAHLSRLKKLVASYPPKLKHAIISGAFLGIDITYPTARTFADSEDIYNTVGCLARVAAYLVQALFALNERYFISDKKVMDAVATFPLRPLDFASRVERTLSQPGTTAAQLRHSLYDFETLWRETRQLAGDVYKIRHAYDAPSA